MKKIITIITFIKISFGVYAQDQTINGKLTLNSNSDGIMTFNNTDNSWQYFEFKNSGVRKTWLGLDNLNNFNIVKENGGNIFLGGANIGIGVSSPLEKLQVAGNLRLSGNVISYGRGIFNNASDTQISLYSPDTWAGISFNDTDGGDFFWFNGQHKTFSIGGQGANVANKKLHIEGGTSIGVGYKGNTVPANGLSVEGSVGIGTASASTQLHVFGDITVGGGSYTKQPKIFFRQNDHSSSGWTVGADGSNTNNLMIYGYETEGDFKIYTNNTQRIVVENDGNVGIGTTAPSAKLEVLGQNVLFLSNTSDNKLQIGRNNAEKISLLVEDKHFYFDLLQDTDENQSHIMYFRNQAGGTSSDNDIRFQTSSVDRLTIKSNGNVGIGTTNPDSKLSVNGKIHTKEVKVDLVGWPDYVFTNTYQLPTLASVEKYIKENGHLPNIPTAKEVAKNGIELGLMHKKLLEKIEELTLYTINQEKKITELEKFKKTTLLQAQKLKKIEEKINRILQHKNN
jgi:hypothetical protein